MKTYCDSIKAREAGRKSKRGQSVKTKLWEALGEMITNQGAERALKYIRGCNDETFMKHYITLLEYFKPKLRRSDLTTGEMPFSSSFDSMTFEQLYELKYGKKPEEKK